MLKDISFGDRVAENEAKELIEYFVETQPWSQLYNDQVDVIFGSKGAGKSALYTLLLNKEEELRSRNIFLLSAEKPTGQTVFSDIKSEPPTSEKEFITLWKVYFCQLIVVWLIDNDLCTGEAEKISHKLKEVSLIEEENSLKRLINSAKAFSKKLINFKVDSVEGGLKITEGEVTGKITFGTPSEELRKQGYQSIDEMLSSLNNHLEEINQQCWILCDRLDVAFEQSLELEKNALRALFKTYRDMTDYHKIRIKIFLRDDIWNRITQDGFREASHITRTTTIEWNNRNLLNLIVRRALKNKVILDKYNVNAQQILSDHEEQYNFYYKMFPKQVDIGERQSDTFDWVLSRIRDGLNLTPPRELIHYYNETISCELREQEINNDKTEEPNLVSRSAIKNAAGAVSKVKTGTLLSEYPQLTSFITALENKKAEHNATTLGEIWSINENNAFSTAMSLAEVGFFEQRAAKNDQLFKIPFVYRFDLNIIQGKAYLNT